MGSFFRGRHPITYERGFVQGAGRILYAPAGTPVPDDIGEIVVLDEGATQYDLVTPCLLYTSPSPRDGLLSRMPSSA